MAATTKAALLEISEKEYAKLLKLIAPIKAEFAMQKRAEDTSIKDVIAHRAHWITLFMNWYADGLAAKPVYFPAEGYKWNDLKRYNADLRKSQASVDWSAAKDALQANHNALIAFLKNTPQDALYGGPMKGANNKWTPGRWA
ncbi:MAG: hypothetical protein ACJA06_002327 [Halocynthiibacter sp.]|jgi:hypothetical protein